MKRKDLLDGEVRSFRLPTTLATAATVDTIALFRAPYNLEVVAVRFLPQGAITGATANAPTLTLMNRGAAGTGTTSIASKVFDTGEDAVAFVPEDLTLTANVNVDEGHVVAIDKAIAGSGLAVEGAIEVEFVSRGA